VTNVRQMKPAELKTRKPTGKPSWPITLLAGGEKAGKTYSAAEASASKLIGRTLWIGVGEDDPDEYGAIPGARFEIVEHDGTYRGVLAAVTAAATLPPTGGKPNLIVLDSFGRVWDLLSDMAQNEANQRQSRKNGGRAVEEARINSDLWNLARQRWDHTLDALREHKGPSIVTARLELVTVFNDNGDPTKEKDLKVKAQKGLRSDVGAIVELPVRGEAYLTGVRSLKWKQKDARLPVPDFTVEKLWMQLGLAEKDATSERQHSHMDAEDKPAAEAQAAQLELAAWCDETGATREDIAAEFAETNGGLTVKDATAGEIRVFLEKKRTEPKKASA
jgi:AAA domain